MGSEITVKLTHAGAARDITRLCASIVNAGSYNNVARTLDLSLLSPRYTEDQPRVSVALGDNVRAYVGGNVLFDGFIFSLQRDSGSETINVGCADRGIYLKQNQAAYRFNGQTPERIAQQVCRDFSLEVGSLAVTGVPVRRNFPGVDLYRIIQTAYTLAAEKTGERYFLRFRGEKLDVIRRERSGASLVLSPGANLLTATVSENAEQLVSQVGIYNENGVRLRTRRNEDAIALCGVMQRYLQTAKDKDVDAEAAAMLEDNDIKRTITVEALGDPGSLAGGNVIVKEPITGLYGLYWIDSDQHSWKNGLYTMKLGLNLKKIMDKATAGKELGK